MEYHWEVPWQLERNLDLLQDKKGAERDATSRNPARREKVKKKLDSVEMNQESVKKPQWH